MPTHSWLLSNLASAWGGPEAAVDASLSASDATSAALNVNSAPGPAAVGARSQLGIYLPWESEQHRVATLKTGHRNPKAPYVRNPLRTSFEADGFALTTPDYDQAVAAEDRNPADSGYDENSIAATYRAPGPPSKPNVNWNANTMEFVTPDLTGKDLSKLAAPRAPKAVAKFTAPGAETVDATEQEHRQQHGGDSQGMDTGDGAIQPAPFVSKKSFFGEGADVPTHNPMEDIQGPNEKGMFNGPGDPGARAAKAHAEQIAAMGMGGQGFGDTSDPQNQGTDLDVAPVQGNVRKIAYPVNKSYVGGNCDGASRCDEDGPIPYEPVGGKPMGALKSAFA